MSYIKNTKSLFWLGFHVLLGVLLAFVPSWSTWWGVGAFFWFLAQTLRSRNRSGMAHLGAAYIVGMEVLLRMSKGALFWEFGKLACIALLFTGLLAERRQNRPWHYFLLLMLFLPSLLLAIDLPPDRYRQMITFQLGGMVLLVLSVIYFKGRKMSVVAVQNLLRYVLYPLAAMLAYLFVRTPSLSEIEFTTGSNFMTSAGFGPNQVSTALGLGMAVLLVNYLLRFPPLFSSLVDKLFFALLAFRALLTFSRGGVMATLLAVLLGYLMYVYAGHLKSLRKTLLRLGLGLLLFAGLFWMVDQLSGHMLSLRYKGAKMEERTTYSLDQVSSGRSIIAKTDLMMFLDHPLWGVGLGESNVLRPQYGYRNISHIEQTRLLSEHGLFGLLMLIWLVAVLLRKAFRGPPLWRFWGIAFCGLAFLTMSHSATRLAMVGFTFGLGLIHLHENHSLHRQPSISGRRLSFRGRKSGAPLTP